VRQCGSRAWRKTVCAVFPSKELHHAEAERKTPAYRLHRHSGQAIVTLSGRDHYLGLFGSAQSRGLYDKRVNSFSREQLLSALARHVRLRR
jgi:hypothetical protein